MRAEGLEPSRSFEHRHLKPACLPFHHARAPSDPNASPQTCRWCELLRRSPVSADSSGQVVNSAARCERPAQPATVRSRGAHHPSSQASADRSGDRRGRAAAWPWAGGSGPGSSRHRARSRTSAMRCSGRCSPGSVSTRTASSFATKRRRPSHGQDGAVTEIPAGLLPERPKPMQPPSDDPALHGVQRLPGRAREERRRKAEQDHRMTTPETPGAPAGAVPVEKIRTALLGYRVMAWTTGLWLIALCYEIVSHLVVPPRDPVDRGGARLGVLRLCPDRLQPRGQGQVADRQDRSVCCSPEPSRCWASSSSTSRPGTSRRASGL